MFRAKMPVSGTEKHGSSREKGDSGSETASRQRLRMALVAGSLGVGPCRGTVGSEVRGTPSACIF